MERALSFCSLLSPSVCSGDLGPLGAHCRQANFDIICEMSMVRPQTVLTSERKERDIVGSHVSAWIEERRTVARSLPIFGCLVRLSLMR